jgi:hypothetical protein
VHCGGQTNPPTTASGCRPHQLTINGVDMKSTTGMPQGTYHLPCFPGSWLMTHVATTANIPLKAGNSNTIKIWPMMRDSANFDAMQVVPAGKGPMPIISPNDVHGSN